MPLACRDWDAKVYLDKKKIGVGWEVVRGKEKREREETVGQEEVTVVPAQDDSHGIVGRMLFPSEYFVCKISTSNIEQHNNNNQGCPHRC